MSAEPVFLADNVHLGNYVQYVKQHSTHDCHCRTACNRKPGSWNQTVLTKLGTSASVWRFSPQTGHSLKHIRTTAHGPRLLSKRNWKHQFIIIIIIIIINISGYNWIYAYLRQGYIAPSSNILRNCLLQGQTLLWKLPHYANRSVVRKGCSMVAIPRQKLGLPFGLPHLQQKFRFVRAGVHAPTKSVSVPAAISVVLIFHVIFMARQYTGPIGQSYQDDHRHVGVMPATPSMNTPDWFAEQMRTRLPCDLMFYSVYGEDRCLLFCSSL